MKHVIAKNPRQHTLMTFGPARWERAANVGSKKYHRSKHLLHRMAQNPKRLLLLLCNLGMKNIIFKGGILSHINTYDQVQFPVFAKLGF